MITPEIQQKFDEMQAQIDALLALINVFNSDAELPPDFRRTLTAALSASSGKSASSENQAVNEAGAGVYNVLKPPDRFIRIGDNNVPAYD